MNAIENLLDRRKSGAIRTSIQSEKQAGDRPEAARREVEGVTRWTRSCPTTS